MFPAHSANNCTDRVGDATLPGNGGDIVMDDRNTVDPTVGVGVDTDVIMGDAAGVAHPMVPSIDYPCVPKQVPLQPPLAPPAPNRDLLHFPTQQQQERWQPFQPQQHSHQPPLGRNASAGDTQPRLTERQDSMGLPSSVLKNAIRAPASTSAQPEALTGSATQHDVTLTCTANVVVSESSSVYPMKTLYMDTTDKPTTAKASFADVTSSAAASSQFPSMKDEAMHKHTSSVFQSAAMRSPNYADTADACVVQPSTMAFEPSQIAKQASVETQPPPEIVVKPHYENVEKYAHSGQVLAVSTGDESVLSGPAVENRKGAAASSVPTDDEAGCVGSKRGEQGTLAVQLVSSVECFDGQGGRFGDDKVSSAPNLLKRDDTKNSSQSRVPEITTGVSKELVTVPTQQEQPFQQNAGGVAAPTGFSQVAPVAQRTAAPFAGSTPPSFGTYIKYGVEGGGVKLHTGPIPGAPSSPPQRPSGGGPFGGMKELRVEDALLYLDDVKREFGDRPRIYNEFLAIMKNFKSQEVDTPGVIARVSKLFRGYNNLILGFNKFLPDGFKISVEDLRQQDAAYAREQEILRQQQAAMEAKTQQLQVQREQHGNQAAMVGPMGLRPPGHPGTLEPSPSQQVTHLAQRLQLHQPQEEMTRQQLQHQSIETPQKLPKQAKSSSAKSAKARKVQQAPQPPPVQHQAVEFDHAISYVTTIKRRFANDPGTYHAFLEILHTYQKEQRGIKEVLEQVAHLFQDHPDLLKEFTFFLPDAVQEQAKERLHRAAAESENRLAMRAKKQQSPMDVDQYRSASQQVIDMTGQRLAVSGDARGAKRPFPDTHDVPAPLAFPQTPESYVYNSAVERQFFDAAKEALASYTRDGGQAWAEFMKCLDMYAQEILSRSEMLNFVEPLLGKRNNKLFEEFKKILAAAGGRGTSTAPPMEDSWYSVPLSEIDFSRCRRCSPSYRALPRDYPAPPTSQRTDEEAKVLNDVWVSLPVGSEESYTFRHMRRNTYEEILFRCEDERFEIDMAIDSNLSTLALLEPFAEEMAILSVNELPAQVDQEKESKQRTEPKGLGAKFFQYTFEPSILSVIHRNAIARIYGDHGAEMLELLKNNPSVAIPIVVKRLRQKDEEWRRVRDRLNRHWKELAEHNYYKSLDHRSLTWRTIDKRAISTRTLIYEIKDRASNNGDDGQAALQARIDKAKEEHGSFYEVTMAKTLSKKLDLSKLPKPDRRLFTPHMSFMYENCSWALRDAYRILSFALERGTISPTDKERCHRLWTEFLGPWFGLSLNWMLSPASKFQESSSPNAMSSNGLSRIVSHDENSLVDDEEESLDGDSNPHVRTEYVRDHGCDKTDSTTLIDHHPLPAGTTVCTVYGEGRIINCRTEDGMYEVHLPLGSAYLRPSSVLCSILAAEKSAFTIQRRNDDRTRLERPDDKLIIGTQSLYLFFRLHQILCRRLCIAKRLAYQVRKDASLQTLVEQMPGGDNSALGRRRYDAFMSLVYALLDGGTGNAAEGGKYEDRVRSLLGHGGYELATMDKLISHILKNIQSMVNDDTMWSLVQLFRRHADAGGFKAEALRQEAAYLSDGEQMYAFQLCPVYKGGGDKSVLYMEYLGVMAGSESEDGSLSDSAVEPTNKRPKRQGLPVP